MAATERERERVNLFQGQKETGRQFIFCEHAKEKGILERPIVRPFFLSVQKYSSQPAACHFTQFCSHAAR